jgi:iron-sulfur cluster assembly protein
LLKLKPIRLNAFGLLIFLLIAAMMGVMQIVDPQAQAIPAPEGVRVGNEKLISLTPSAGEKIASLIERDAEGPYLRCRVAGGGCNGLSYKIKLTKDAKSGDILVYSQGAAVLIDPKSALYLRGTVLDYSSNMIGGGFKFTNPNATSSCSCGESFSV